MCHPEEPGPISDGALDGGSQPAAEAAPEQFYDPAQFTLADMVRCGATLRTLAAQSANMEEAAQKVTRHLYDGLKTMPLGRRCCVLVRFFKTQSYGRLSEDLRKAARSAATSPLAEGTKCLVLLGTSGDEPQWNKREESRWHKCLPLQSQAVIEEFPMISRLIRQLGMPMSELLRPAPEIIKDFERKNFGVFYVPVAAGSPFVPAQKEFVIPFGVQSVLGFGGILADGELFAVIIFSRTPIPSATAEMFRTIALSLKLGLLALLDKPVFRD
jgi:hypothetical protein